MSPLFLAAIEATEEAVYNSLFMATTTTGHGHTVEALPIARTMEILRKYGVGGETADDEVGARAGLRDGNLRGDEVADLASSVEALAPKKPALLAPIRCGKLQTCSAQRARNLRPAFGPLAGEPERAPTPITLTYPISPLMERPCSGWWGRWSTAATIRRRTSRSPP